MGTSILTELISLLSQLLAYKISSKQYIYSVTKLIANVDGYEKRECEQFIEAVNLNTVSETAPESVHEAFRALS